MKDAIYTGMPGKANSMTFKLKNMYFSMNESITT